MDCNGEEDISFTPDRSGCWVLYTSDSYDDPNLNLLGPDGSLLRTGNHDVGENNDLIVADLVAGTTYTIEVRYSDTHGGNRGSCKLTVLPGETIPGDGGSVRARGLTGIAFTPNESGEWEFRTSDNDGDPMLFVYNDTDWWYLAFDDDGAGDLNALIIIWLEAGATYYIHAGNYDYSDDAFTVTVQQHTGGSTADVLDDIMSSIQVNAPTEMEYSHWYESGGLFVIYTSDRGDCDPILEVRDSEGNVIARDDDSWGDLNAMVVFFVEGGKTYTILADTWGGMAGSYTVTMKYSPRIFGSGSYGVENTSSFEFYPERSGTYEFRTSESWGSDPMLEIYDYAFNLIASDDDSADGVNALLTVVLEAEMSYYVLVSFHDQGEGTCTMTIAGPW